ncbi:ABC transporter ATP-binding protein [Litorisediminicola beolgyonensis]|uniref:ABC transporter ATP-binding protein n=1 Tax=Litorisediminicola beolgyonensis TaxID=1173614 RepID=A0ABW3ZNH2_9RHOB
MIRLDHLTKSFRVQGARKIVIDDLSLDIPTGMSLALLGRNGAGKSTLLQLIAGTLRPDHGRVLTDGAVSWQIGQGNAFHRELTGAQNVRFLARLYGVDTAEMSAFVRDFAELGAHFHMPLRSYSSGMKSRLTFGASMAIPFDTYLIDEVTAVGDARFKRKSLAVFKDRLKGRSAVFVSHQMKQVREFCNAALVLEEGRAHFFDDVDAAIEMHQDLMR